MTSLVVTGPITRAALGADAKDWTLLGKTVLGSAAIRTATITWTGTFEQLWFEFFISGYSGNAIGRLIVGPASGLSETGTTFCSSLIEGVTLNTTSVSVPGWPSAVTSNNVARWGYKYVQNVATQVKRMSGFGQWGGTPPTVAPTTMAYSGIFNDATNSIQQAELASYTAITGAAISAVTFNSGTSLTVWGRHTD